MIPDGTYVAVVDRIEDGLATLQLEREDALYNLVVGEEELPERAQHADAILDVELDDDELVSASYDPETTRARKEQAQSRFNRLSERPPRDDNLSS